MSSYENPDYDFQNTNPGEDNHKKFLRYHGHPISIYSISSHSHSGGFKNGWDTHNRMYSHTCHWLVKKEQPQYIKDIREKLVGWYGDGFDSDFT